jgi:translation initiation factor IF-3
MKNNPNAEILVLDENGNNLGRMPYRDAKSLATSRNLDLVQVNKKGEIEVFKIMDYGKYKYDKKKHKQKKNPHPVKEMNFKMRIDPHDQEIKIKRIKSFLEKGADVKISVTMRGREKANPRLAHQKMDQILEAFGDTIQVQQRHGSPSAIFATIRPVEKHSGKKKDEHEANVSNRNSGHEDADKESHQAQKAEAHRERSAAIG